MAKVQVVMSQSFKHLGTSMKKAVQNGIEDCTADLLRVASLRTPVDSTTLEQSGSSKVSTSSTKVTGHVSFKAMNKGYNYAKRMNDAKYNLGEKSLKKSKAGVRSRFCSESLKVGTGYLTDTAEKCEQGYTDYVQDKVNEVIKSGGFNR